MSRVLRGSRALVASAKTTTAPAAPKTSPNEGGLVKTAAGPRKTKGPTTLPPSVRRFLGLPSETPTADPTGKILKHLKLLQRQNPKNGRLISFVNHQDKLKAMLERKDKFEVLEIAKIVSDFAKLK